MHQANRSHDHHRRGRPRRQDGDEPERHPVIRVLLALLGLAAIALACVILIWPAPFSSTSTSNKTTKEPTKTTTVSETKTSSPSDALVGGVLGVGVLLLLAAALFDRLQELKGPAGTGIVLAPLPAPTKEEKGKLATLAIETLRERKGTEPTPEEAARVAIEAATTAQSRVWRMRVGEPAPEPGMIGPIDVLFRSRLDEDELRAAVGEAVDVELIEEDRGERSE
jgi:hypothetical protein